VDSSHKPYAGARPGDKGLKKDAIAFADALIIWRLGRHAGFFGRRREIVDPDEELGREATDEGLECPRGGRGG